MDERTLAAPRFDEAAAQQARPVVPLSEEAVSINLGEQSGRVVQPSSLPSIKGSWLLAAFVGLILGAVVTAIGVTAYRRSQATSTQSLVPAAEAIRVELNGDFRARPSSRNAAAAPAQQTVSVETAANATAAAPKSSSGETASNPTPVPRSLKRRTVTVTASSESASSEDDSDADSSGKPKPRLVDRYVMRP